MAAPITAPGNKRQLATYLNDVLATLQSPAQLEAEAERIIGTVRRIMRPYIQGERSSERQQYYSLPVTQIEKAYAARDFENFSFALDSLVGRIELE